MDAYAADILTGNRSIKRAELLEFMRAYAAQPASAAPGDPALVPWASVSTTATGAVHVGKNVNHFYSRDEARGLAAKILAAAVSAK